MSWNEVTVMDRRKEFASLGVQGAASVSLLCRRFGISRKTGYKWLKRAESGEEGWYRDRSRKPKRSPGRKSVEVENAVLAIRGKRPSWGGRKIRKHLEKGGLADLPAASTITAILRRHNQISREESLKRGPMERFEREAPNELWQMDFKGHFPTTTGPCHPLTIVDDHSRYALCVAACPDQRALTVRAALTSVFRLYGLPERMLMDNGSCWRSLDGPYTVLTAWLIRQGVRLSHGRPFHPQTQGKNERFNRTLKEDAIRGKNYHDLADCQNGFDIFRHIYNHERPHEALGLETPASRYCPSVFEFREFLPVIEYLPGDIVRHVGTAGFISYRKDRYHVGRAFSGEPVALRQTARDGILAVYYCHHDIAALDLREKTCAQH